MHRFMPMEATANYFEPRRREGREGFLGRACHFNMSYSNAVALVHKNPNLRFPSRPSRLVRWFNFFALSGKGRRMI
jgi:hypothetical protein